MENEVYLLGEVNPKLTEMLAGINLLTVRDLTNKTKIVALIVRGELAVDRELITQLPNLKVIISAGIGYDNIDLEAAAERQIPVANCPYASAISTAEHSLALTLSGMRNIVKSNLELREGRWDRKNNQVVQFYNKKVGIVGMGRIGRYVAQLYNAIGFEVLAYDPFVPNYHFQRVRANKINSLELLCENVSYLSIHLPRSEETHNIINSENIKLLKHPNGIVNTCRGGIVNEEAVLKNLNSGDLDFYAADVFNNEPTPNSELINNPKVIATPHIAANTYDAQEQILSDVFSQLKEVLVENLKPAYLVGGSYL